MGNLRKLRRRIRHNGHNVRDIRPGASAVRPDHPGPGRHNAYRCPVCELYTVVRHVDAGDTPYFIRCLATPECKGNAKSIGYPDIPFPDKLVQACRYEWYRPDWNDPILNLPEYKEQIEKGGLALRHIA